LARYKIAAQNFTCQTSQKLNSQHSHMTKTAKNELLTNLRLVATRHFNFLPHAISILNRKISNQNARHCGAFLPWLLKSTLVWPSWL
jgi:hypothetical protein